tara:strand:+ start:934 stop:1305 length:372 start_codon:yes stop_codon:yes gene_type:complete
MSSDHIHSFRYLDALFKRLHDMYGKRDLTTFELDVLVYLTQMQDALKGLRVRLYDEVKDIEHSVIAGRRHEECLDQALTDIVALKDIIQGIDDSAMSPAYSEAKGEFCTTSCTTTHSEAKEES